MEIVGRGLVQLFEGALSAGVALEIENGPKMVYIISQATFDGGFMKHLRVSEDIVPIAQFKGRASRWLRQIGDSGQAVIITLNGKPAGVLMSPAEFDRMQERERFLESVATGLADAEAGRVRDTAELRKRLGDLHRTVRRR